MTETKTLGEKLYDLRKKHNLTMDDLCKIFNNKYNLKLNKGTISKWENNLTEPTNIYVATYAKHFGADMNYLLGIEPSNVTKGSILTRAQKELSERDLRILEKMALEMLNGDNNGDC